MSEKTAAYKPADAAENGYPVSTPPIPGPGTYHDRPQRMTLEQLQAEQDAVSWPAAKRWRILGVVSAMTVLTPLASSLFAPAVSQVMTEFDSANVILSETIVSIYVLGFAVGPLFAAPLSEVYGRKWVYLLSCALFLVFTIACATSSSLPMLIVFRFLAGCFGATPTTLGGATIGDMFPKEKRGGAMALWGIGVQLGPAIGPVIGGFLASAKGWRWVFWLLAILTGFLLIVGIIVLRETYAPVLLKRRITDLNKEAGGQYLEMRQPDQESLPRILSQAITRPIAMLFTSPIVFLLSLFTAMLFGELYLFITTFPSVFQN
ncbi:hypothetical protein ONS95_005121 [Cadophora gregata]|uniref:uncharacterized protein n=1 Tax=Cadophora gregata TaxID=51156 RepID=UPI0026DC96FE|nr:uncharacterized protein ONS95_005121 [Cadophora gregata]KAK0104855.1 hypothetical protein ONS95_005121 [Cadophora gregata]KAK0115065.1 hypothetical protein ONS96_013535 [Cadophora gregata f. sp. sojae]